jgi:hypothetical protein
MESFPLLYLLNHSWVQPETSQRIQKFPGELAKKPLITRFGKSFSSKKAKKKGK